ncbi:DUF1702 family protein [Dictyobacter aurantiacus]|uniref:Enediyne biosynthesis protein n=1 Tax=Dictyobacter aurantiacus TaxID=1936993 RepID=A0A401ZLG8_9CHLR|nr:DUF1702 family protein [Dictyobacter aurantiacus]GCE07693.1 enediyne biosynthesis protein [Dictyobacter aurantiacus]
MSFTSGGLLSTLLRIGPAETDFDRHGFHSGTAATREQLEQCALSFVHGYNTTLSSETNAILINRLNQVEQQYRGFAYEGAGMALAILDFIFPWQKRFMPLTLNEGNDYIYLLYVGWGWSMGRLPRKRIRPEKRAPYDPLLSWLSYDGYGFHEGFFSWKKSYLQQRYPISLPRGYARQAFDQGLGRGLWFVGCGDIFYISDIISAFPPLRQAELWSGIGLAATYAGGVSSETLQQLRQATTKYYPYMAQGAAFAIKARQRAHNIIPHTHLASDILCGLPVDDVIQIVDISLENLPLHQTEPAFELWRHRIRDSLHLPTHTI